MCSSIAHVLALAAYGAAHAYAQQICMLDVWHTIWRPLRESRQQHIPFDLDLQLNDIPHVQLDHYRARYVRHSYFNPDIELHLTCDHWSQYYSL